MPDILVYTTGEGGPAGEVHIETRTDLPIERPGRGSVHHVAFRVPTMEDYPKWEELLTLARLYYFWISGSLLFQIDLF